MHRDAKWFMDEKEKKNYPLFCELERVIYQISVWSLFGTLLQQPFRKYKVKRVVVKYDKSDYRILYSVQGDKLYVFVVWGRENVYDFDINIVKHLLQM